MSDSFVAPWAVARQAPLNILFIYSLVCLLMLFYYIFLGGSMVKKLPANAGVVGLILKWQPTAIFLSGNSHRQWSCKSQTDLVTK